MSVISLSKAEKAYIQSSLLSTPPIRADGRAPHDFRAIALETGVAPLANGSARVSIGVRTAPESAGGTEILATVKLEVESIEVGGAGVDGGRISCMVSCSPSAYPHLSAPAVEDCAHDLTTIVQQTLSHPSLHPPNLEILRGKKTWALHLDLLVLADCGNVHDALFLAARAALWDTRVPRTRPVEYRAAGADEKAGERDMEVDVAGESGLDTRGAPSAIDFELPDYWDEGAPLGGRDRWPVCVTLNLLPPLYFLDATSQEEASAPSKLLLLYSFPSASTPPSIQAIRLLGPGETDILQMKTHIANGQTFARSLASALEAKLREEDVRRGEKARARFAGIR